MTCISSNNCKKGDVCAVSLLLGPYMGRPQPAPDMEFEVIDRDAKLDGYDFALKLGDKTISTLQYIER